MTNLTASLSQYLHRLAFTALLVLLASSCVSQTSRSDGDTVTISVIGTNDVHGQLVAQRGRGGLAVFSGYVNALRAEREQDNGAVLLIDAGDMWQGTLESNLSEGKVMVEAYNALGYTAAAVGNHEFDFGPVGERSTPDAENRDARGALKARASEAQFPLLAANLIDTSTRQPVNWPNVKPSVLLDVAGVKVGIIGVMTYDALEATIAANVRGLKVAPLVDTISREARALRADGATVVIVTAHAGGSCREFNNPYDLSTCDMDDEIMQVASNLPSGLVNQIIAGHHHRGIAHFINNVAVTAAFSSTRSFGRVDYTINTARQSVSNTKIHAPQRPCPFVNKKDRSCVWEATDSPDVVGASYAGRAVVSDKNVASIVEKAKKASEKLKATKLGVYLETPITLADNPDSALGHLMTDALLATSNADIAIHNVSGGIRANLTAGELTFGKVYQMFPFDNRVVVLDVSGADMRRIIAKQAHKKDKRAGFSGMSVHVKCRNNKMTVKMMRSDGTEIDDTDQLRLAVNDFLALGGDGILNPIIPEEGFQYPSDTPLARDAVIEWLSQGDSRLNAQQFLEQGKQRWHMANTIPAKCAL